MEQTALRPKPMPGRTTGPAHRPHAVRRRGRRLLTALFTTLVALVLVLAGVGLGTVGATVIGMSKLADLKQRAGAPPSPGKPAGGAGEQQGKAPSQPEAQGGKEAKGGAAGTGGRVGQGGAGEAGASAVRGQATVVRASLGVQAVDPPRGAGALLVAVHNPGPGHTAGLERGDVLLGFGAERIASAAELAEAVAAVRPGTSVTLTVRHESGVRQSLTVRPGVVT